MSKPKKSKRFRYELETLLKVRVIKEKQEKDKYTKAVEAYEAELKKEEDLKNKQAMFYSELLELMRSSELPSMNIIEMRKAHLDNLQTEIEAQIKVREEAEKKRDDQRQVLVQASREKKIIEKDKEKTREAWRKLMDKEAGKFLDDIAGIGFNRKRRLSKNG